ncbi:GumC family protein [Bacterioplanoides sp.]|uniref:GumC family protein n=1 Tax=Bacterioplanoides sp. TaxID=2066072 RepID=UPI003B00E039
MKTQDYIKEFATIFFIQRNIIVGVVLAAVLIGILVVLFAPRSYQAKGAVILKGSQLLQSQETLTDVRAEVGPISEADLFSDMEIIQSQDVVMGAIFRVQASGHLDVDVTDSEELNKLAVKIQKSLNTTLVPRSTIIRVALNWNSPEVATYLLSAIFEEYLQRRQSVFNPEEEVAFFETQLNAFHNTLDDLENEMVSISGGTNAQSLRNLIKRNIELLADLERDLTGLEADRIAKSHYVDYLEANLDKKGFNLFTSIDSLELGDFSKKVQDLLIAKEAKSRVYTDVNPEVIKDKKLLERLYTVYKEEVISHIDKERSELRGVEGQINMAKQQMMKVEEKNAELYQMVLAAERLDREHDVIEDSYKTFATRYREAKIRSETQSDRLFSVAILERAYASTQSIFPKASKVLPISLILGLLLGVTIGFLREFFDHRFKRPEDISNYIGLPYLFSVPEKNNH